MQDCGEPEPTQSSPSKTEIDSSPLKSDSRRSIRSSVACLGLFQLGGDNSAQPVLYGRALVAVPRFGEILDLLECAAELLRACDKPKAFECAFVIEAISRGSISS